MTTPTTLRRAPPGAAAPSHASSETTPTPHGASGARGGAFQISILRERERQRQRQRLQSIYFVGRNSYPAEPAEQSALPSPRGRKVDWAYVPPRYLDQRSGLREAPEGASPRGRTASLQGAASQG